MAGINRALKTGYERAIYEHQIASKIESRACVFISHKSSDMEAAEAVANYLMSNDIDVYLDKLDAGLQKKTEEMDAKGIVESINKALKCCTHIIVLVSDQTKESWWVPYEVGYSKNGEKKIASALLTGYIDGFPDYLKIERTIKCADEFKAYALEIKGEGKRYGAIFESVNEPIGLNKYIRSV